MRKYKAAIGHHIERLIPDIPVMKDLYEAGVAKYRFASKYAKGKVVLDAGCGMGYGSGILHERGATRVVGIDKSEEAISFAKVHYKKDSVQFMHMDCTKMSFENNYFDTVISFEVIEHIRDPRLYLKEVKRVLKKRGKFVLSTPNRIFGSWKDPNPYHEHEFEYHELRRILKEYFSEVTIYGFDLVHPQAIKYKEVSKRLERISNLFLRLGFISKFIPKKIKDNIFDFLTPDYPVVNYDDFRISLTDPIKNRVFIALSR